MEIQDPARLSVLGPLVFHSGIQTLNETPTIIVNILTMPKCQKERLKRGCEKEVQYMGYIDNDVYNLIFASLCRKIASVGTLGGVGGKKRDCDGARPSNKVRPQALLTISGAARG